jgi:hypothetical protein
MPAPTPQGLTTAPSLHSAKPASAKPAPSSDAHRKFSARFSLVPTGLKKQRINKEHSCRFDVNHALSTKAE